MRTQPLLVITALIQVLIEQDENGKVQIRFEARHAGEHATTKELAVANSMIEGMRTTSKLARDLHEPAEGHGKISGK